MKLFILLSSILLSLNLMARQAVCVDSHGVELEIISEDVWSDSGKCKFVSSNIGYSCPTKIMIDEFEIKGEGFISDNIIRFSAADGELLLLWDHLTNEGLLQTSSFSETLTCEVIDQI